MKRGFLALAAVAALASTTSPLRAEPLAKVVPASDEVPSAEPAPTLTAAQREALKAEIKAELAAELKAERDAAKPKGHPVANDKNTYKPGTGLHLESEDGEFALATRLRVQLRQQVEWFRRANATETKQVFQLRRARVQFKGHTFGEHNKFKLELAFSPRDLGIKDGVIRNTPLLTWFVEFDHLRDLTLRAGQYKIPYSRQRVISSGDLQLVDRAIANGEFNHDRDIGFDIRSKDLFGLGGYLKYYAGVYMGEGRDFGDKNASPDLKLHYLGRLEVLPMGKFKDYKEADLKREKTPKLSLGGAYAYHHEAQRDRGVLGGGWADEGTGNYHSLTADYMLKYDGFSTSGEVHWRNGRRVAPADDVELPEEPVPMRAPRNGYGWFVQAGYVFPGMPLEIAGRYSAVHGIGDEDPGDLTFAADRRRTPSLTSLKRLESAGGGVSYYFGGHPLKLQADYFRTWNEGDTSDGSNTVRIQLQVAL